MPNCPDGALVLMLHCHLPYVRGAGRWPFGEEWLYEAMAETYVPLLQKLYGLAGRGCQFRLAVGITPVLAEQLSDHRVRKGFVEYLRQRQELARADGRRFQREGWPEHFRMLADGHAAFYEQVELEFTEHWDGDLLAAFRSLQDQGYLEVFTSAATHGFLPLLGLPEAVEAQVAVGVAAYRRHFRREPAGFWLPECAYRPGLEGILVRHGLRYTLLAEHAAGQATAHSAKGPAAAGQQAAAADGPVSSSWLGVAEPLLPRGRGAAPPRDGPRTNGGRGTAVPPFSVAGSPLAAFIRSPDTARLVWSRLEGYPGDFAYREFHKRYEKSGLPYWRITSASGNLGSKEPYNPAAAQARVQEHARHFVQRAKALARQARQRDGQFAVLASPYDGELFGHWWAEGVEWLGQVLETLSSDPELVLMTPSQVLNEHPPQVSACVHASSWGAGGDFRVWNNDGTAWMWPLIHRAERDFVQKARTQVAAGRSSRCPAEGAPALEQRLLNQAGRELLLLESSDWPFLITTGQARDYARERFEAHRGRFEALMTELGAPPGAGSDRVWKAVEALEQQDWVFPDLDYRLWASREEGD